jgi:hypothetical protein
MGGMKILCRGRGHLLEHGPNGWPRCARCHETAPVTYTCLGCGERKRQEAHKLSAWMALHRACMGGAPAPLPVIS